MKKIILNEKEYEIVENYRECFNFEDVESLFTEYFFDYDYILGDYAYNKLRLKGFYNSNNKNVKKYNDIKYYKKYLEDFCAVNCSYFLLKKKISIEKNK